jgi:hypothetical protein
MYDLSNKFVAKEKLTLNMIYVDKNKLARDEHWEESTKKKN